MLKHIHTIYPTSLKPITPKRSYNTKCYICGNQTSTYIRNAQKMCTICRDVDHALFVIQKHILKRSFKTTDVLR